MNIKQEYINLYTEDGRTAAGFIRLTYGAKGASFQVQLRRGRPGTLALVYGRTVLRFPFENGTCSGQARLTGPVTAAVLDQAGRLIAFDGKGDRAALEKQVCQPVRKKESVRRETPKQEQVILPEEQEAPAPAAEQTGQTQTVQEDSNLHGPGIEGWVWRPVESVDKGMVYYLGERRSQTRVEAVAVAVPGAWAPVPPAVLQGFTHWQNGYWLLAQDAQTGQAVPL
ncbi:MAG: hypothetical protein IJP30_00470 [Clostridia bacterium]|nr:hypothetical protein [Clostridia bacterium]